MLLQLDLAERLRARRRASPAEFVATLELQERRYKEVGMLHLEFRVSLNPKCMVLCFNEPQSHVIETVGNGGSVLAHSALSGPLLQ